ncbi:MAG: UvrD-helicase domain-containing protein, partial [Desulfomonilia bacterium]
MRPLDLIHVPLHGVQLIEASAGTGKTYTIASLYVRLLLEIPLQVREILVVTFTEAATDELKTRIRKKLHEALKCFSSGSCDDQFLKDLAGRCPDRAEAIRRLQAALRRFDEASIHTIHGFCQRVLGELPFEAGCLFEHELVPDQSGIVLEAAGDFIRLHFGESMLPELAFHAARRGYTLEFFLRLYQRFRPGIRVIPQAELPEPDGIIDAFRRSFARLAERWKEARDEVAGILQDFEGFKQNIYSPSILRRMIDAMDTYVSSPESAVELFSDYERFTPWKLRAGTKADFDPPEHDFFELWDTHLELHGRLQEYLESCLVRLKVEFLRHMEEALPARKEASGVVSFDDLLLKVRDGLRSERGADLGQSLRQRYRAALIDEFQDTDPVQYEIFSSVFSRGPLFLIGDPKQAIYSFRGADIFTYLRAAAGVSTEARHTLGKNFRSEPGLVRAVNHLFDTHEPFVFEEIAFSPVEPAQDAGRPLLHEPGRAPFAVWCVSDEPSGGLAKADAEARIYRAVACEISRLIEAGCRGEILLGDRPVAAGDMAVIVRTNRHGGLMRDVLASCGIPCVVSSQEDLFDTDEAREMEFLLRAIAQPHSEPLVRTALAGPILGLDAHGLDLLDRDEGLLEWWIERFRRYHDLWQTGGFTRMFRRLLDEEHVRERVLGLAGGERMLTNLLHLSEVLGSIDMEERPGMRGLVKWLNRRRDRSVPRGREHQLRLESDDEAVKVLTVHKSKGLEFPIVFCPFLWGSSDHEDETDIVFHDPGRDLEAFLDLGSPGLKEHLDLASRELEAEEMRLLYVALTRARNRCYLVWKRPGKKG